MSETTSRPPTERVKAWTADAAASELGAVVAIVALAALFYAVAASM